MKVKANDKQIVVTVTIKPGPSTLAARHQWSRFFPRLISEVNDEIKDAQKESPSSQAPVEDALTDGGEGINP